MKFILDLFVAIEVDTADGWYNFTEMMISILGGDSSLALLSILENDENFGFEDPNNWIR